ncbi:MAG: hypothetical protein ACREI5_09735 [Candidatus Methylomirabilales bacterium]
MITDHLFLGPDREVLCGLEEIRRYVEGHYTDRRACSRCGCYLIPASQTQGFFFQMYQCANTICCASLRTFKMWPQWLQRVA